MSPAKTHLASACRIIECVWRFCLQYLSTASTAAFFLVVSLCWTPLCRAEEQPFIVTYTSYLEERRNLEINSKNLVGSPSRANRFGATVLEFEYGATSWWTTEVYFDGQATAGQGALFTGYRWENRFKVLPENRWINPVLYSEFEILNEADKTLLEVVGHDTVATFIAPNDISKRVRKREWENKLILGSSFKGWTLAENLIFEKNLSGGPWEFGYAAAASHALSQKPGKCKFCARNVQVGAEVYGGLGDTSALWLHNTSHYLAPVVAWTAGEATFRISPTFGLNDNSAGFLFRFGVSYEIEGFGHAVGKILHIR